MHVDYKVPVWNGPEERRLALSRQTHCFTLSDSWRVVLTNIKQGSNSRGHDSPIVWRMRGGSEQSSPQKREASGGTEGGGRWELGKRMSCGYLQDHVRFVLGMRADSDRIRENRHCDSLGILANSSFPFTSAFNMSFHLSILLSFNINSSFYFIFHIYFFMSFQAKKIFNEVYKVLKWCSELCFCKLIDGRRFKN